MNAKQVSYASPHTTLGQLQRGQGRCYLAARDTNDVAALLDCIRNDCRVDPRTQRHELFFAHLALDLNIDATDIASCLGVGQFDLCAEVLGELGA